ncbi:MAG: transcriptional regulator with GAF, ATPase, and Fis domain, partial [Planctomycetota bacterium]
MWDGLRAEPFNVLAVEDESLEGTPESFISQVRSLPDAPEVLVLVSDSGAERRAELQAAQAFAIIDRAASKDEVSNALAGITARLIEKVHIGMLAEQATMESRLSDFASDSPVMKEFLTLVRKVVGSESTLLVLGETGVGKEYLARAMHAESSRSSGPFVPVNCAALSESLMESELFGHVEGAFTGASRGRRGCFEMAHGGTLFLDEIGELPASTQVKLLRALQERKVQPVGSELELEVHVRLIAATNRDLAQEVE